MRRAQKARVRDIPPQLVIYSAARCSRGRGTLLPCPSKKPNLDGGHCWPRSTAGEGKQKKKQQWWKGGGEGGMEVDFLERAKTYPTWQGGPRSVRRAE
jgi:hypothetical protein